MTKDLKDLLAALTEEERDAILEHDVDSRLGRLVLECLKPKKPKPLPVPGLMLNAGNRNVAHVMKAVGSNNIYLRTGDTGGAYTTTEALQIARALVVGAMALEGVELKPQQPNDIRPHIDAKGCATSVTLFLDGLLARLE